LFLVLRRSNVPLGRNPQPPRQPPGRLPRIRQLPVQPLDPPPQGDPLDDRLQPPCHTVDLHPLVDRQHTRRLLETRRLPVHLVGPPPHDMHMLVGLQHRLDLVGAAPLADPNHHRRHPRPALLHHLGGALGTLDMLDHRIDPLEHLDQGGRHLVPRPDHQHRRTGCLPRDALPESHRIPVGRPPPELLTNQLLSVRRPSVGLRRLLGRTTWSREMKQFRNYQHIAHRSYSH
jgi:hypothetical protein